MSPAALSFAERLAWGRALISVVLVVTALAISAASLQSLRDQEGAYVEFPSAPPDVWNPALFRIISFGHLPAFVDWFWLKALQDPAIYHVPDGQRASVYYTYDLLTSLDPYFREGYTVGAKLLTVVRDDNQGALNLLLKSDHFRKQTLGSMPAVFKERYWSREWEISMLLAYVYLFELDNLPLAAERFIEAAAYPDAPPYLASLAARLQKPGGQFEVAIRLMGLMIEGKKGNDLLQQELIRKRDSVYVLEYVTRVREKFAEYLAANAKSLDRGSAPDAVATRLKHWDHFVQVSGPELGGLKDPFGGKVYLSDDGRVLSTTPTVSVLGLTTN
jgi:hypothetical protein